MTKSRTGVALVTGANRGLGGRPAANCWRRGWTVLTGRDEHALQRALSELGQSGTRAMTVRMDVTDVASIETAHRAVAERFGGVDILVNNAAVLLYENEDVLSIPAEGYRRTFDANLFGVIETCRVFVPDMARAKHGRIVNVSSGVAQSAGMSTYAPAYSTSKVALHAFTRMLAEAYRGTGVQVNAVDPGCPRADSFATVVRSSGR